MSAFPEADRGAEQLPRLSVVGEDTEDITRELARQYRWALSHIAVGQFKQAEQNYLTILANLNGDVVGRANILLEKAEMHEMCEERWPAYQDYLQVLEIMTEDSNLEGATEMRVRAQEASLRLKAEMDQFIWPQLDNPTYITSDTNEIGEHGSDEWLSVVG